MIANAPGDTSTCQICGESKRELLRYASLVNPGVTNLIIKHFPKWEKDDWICLADLMKYQNMYVQNMLMADKGELTDLENEVINGLKEHEILAKNTDMDYDKDRKFAEILSDRIASFGGSWWFIILFGFVMLTWIVGNSILLSTNAFDPYPYILLNLILSTIAALQAPVIMMSQNRQESRDRMRAMHDYQINLKAELEIRQLHQKVDHLLSHQWERLLEIQTLQLELMQEMRTRA